jgi:ABC-type Fe3+-siderophore transport system permease subunit
MSIKKVNIPKSLNWFSASGIVLSLVGLFLPWGSYPWHTLGIVDHPYYVGVEILVGDFALIGCLWSLGFFVRSLRHPIQPTRLVIAGEFVVALFSAFWILFPNIISYFFDFEQGYLRLLNSFYPSTPLYGAYVSLTGALIALITLSLKRYVKID